VIRRPRQLAGCRAHVEPSLANRQPEPEKTFMPTSKIAARLVIPGTLCVVMMAARAAVAAPMIYFYQGNILETSGVYECPPVCSLSGSILLESELEANRPLGALTPLWFDFSNGLDTFTPLTTFTGGGRSFTISTDASGAIEEWLIQLVLAADGTYLETWDTPSGYMTPWQTADWTFTYGCSETPVVCAPIGVGLVRDNAGTWTSRPFTGESPIPVPEPCTLLLLGSGLAIAARKVGRPLNNGRLRL
jgi:hypothetical protein